MLGRFLCEVCHHLHKRQNSSRTSCLLFSQWSKRASTKEGLKGLHLPLLCRFQPLLSITCEESLVLSLGVNFIHVGNC